MNCAFSARIDHTVGNFRINLQFSLPKSCLTAIVGPSGAGKTTLLRCLAGLERPSRGAVRINNTVWQDSDSKLWTPPHRRAVGYVFQDIGLFPHLSVAENIRYGAKRSGEQTNNALVEELIGIMNLSPLLSKNSANLSGGEKQRVAIVRALARNPAILLLDEPMSSLDTNLKNELLPFIRALKAKLDIPILYVTHNMKEVDQLADRILIVEGGELLEQGQYSDLLNNPAFFSKLGISRYQIVQGVVESIDENICLCDFRDFKLWVVTNNATVGASIRIRIDSRDVFVTHQYLQSTKPINHLPVDSLDYTPDETGGALAVCRVGQTILHSQVLGRPEKITTDGPKYLQILRTDLLLG